MARRRAGIATRARQRRLRWGWADKGIRQFLDIGTGIPTRPNLHEVVQEISPDARIVYADNDRCKSGCAHDRG